MHHPRALGLALAVTAAISFGLGPVLAKGLFDAGLGWLETVFWRFAIGALVSWIWLLTRPSSRRALRELSRHRWLVLAVIGSMMAANTSAYYAAIELVPVSLAALIQAIYPAIVAVLSVRFGHMASGPRPWVALVMAIGGVALVIGGFQVGGSAMGIVLAVLSPLIYAFVMVFSAQIAGERRGTTAASRTGGGPDTDSAVAAAVMLSAATAALFAVSVVLGRPVGPTSVPTDAWPSLLVLGLVTGGLGMQAMYAATARIGAAQTALVDTLEPVSAVILAAIFLGERLEPVQLLGGAIVLAGVVIAQTAPPGARGGPIPAADSGESGVRRDQWRR